MPAGAYAGELPLAAQLAGGDPTTFAAAAATLSANPALAAAVREQNAMKLELGKRITALEGAVVMRQQAVAAAIYDMQRITHALTLAQRDAFAARAALATAHRQLAALDVNGRRLADTARLADLQRALAMTQSTLAPGTVMTETQRVVNAQLAASLTDQIAVVQARLKAAAAQIDAILAANATAAAVAAFKAAEEKEAAASAAWAEAQRLRGDAERVNVVRAHQLAAVAHEAVAAAGKAAVVASAGGGAGNSGSASGGKAPKTAEEKDAAPPPAPAAAAAPPAAPAPAPAAS